MIIKKRNIFLIFTTLLLFTQWIPAVQSQDQDHIIDLEKSTEPLHIRVLFKDNPANEAVISWTTTLQGSYNTLYYDTEPRHGDKSRYSNRSETIHTGQFSLRKYTFGASEVDMESWYHHAYIDDLEPNTRYYLMVETDGRHSEEYYFHTAPDDDTPVALLIGGDSRVASERSKPDNNRRKMNERMSILLEENPHILALAHTADYTNRAYWSQFYWWLKDHHEKTTTNDNRLLPIIASRGNHDLDVGFEEAFWWPERETDFYYASQINGEIAMIVLNTEISISGDQRVWLENTLRDIRPKNRYVTAMFHKPIYPSVRAYDGAEGRRRAWAPLFDEHKVDLVAVGHDHALKRTVPILAEEPNPEGIVYIGDGGLGVPTREVDESRWYLQNPGMTESIFNVHLVEFSTEQIHIRAFGMEGDILDEFLIPADREQRRIDYEAILSAETE